MNSTRRFSWPLVLSVGLHTSLVAGLLYASVNQMTAPAAVVQPMRVTLVAPVAAPPPMEPSKEVAQREPEPTPEPEAVPVQEPVPVPVPEPPAPVQQPKPRPKPVHKEVVKPRHRETERESEPAPVAPTPTEAPVRTASAPAAAPVARVADTGPKVLSRPDPNYPERARALNIEGTVKIQFDVDDSGQVQNLTILSATPRNMFEREIRQIVRRWRYESGKPGKNLNITIQFKLSGVSTH